MKVKDSARKHLLDIYEKYGSKVAIETARASLTISKGGSEFKSQFNGEICETVLEIILKELCKKNSSWIYLKSVVLPDTETLSDFLTEIDFVLITGSCIYCIECKSYAGDKTIINEGTVVLKNGKKRDVYKQDLLHLEVLGKLLHGFSKTPKYKIVFFNFSTGEVNDLRDHIWKEKFPLVNDSTFTTILENSKPVWDLVGLRRAAPKIEKFSKQNRDRHLAYVKSKHGGS